MYHDFEETKKGIRKIGIASDHRLQRDRWRSLKEILDELSKKAPPLDPQPLVRLEIARLSERQKDSLSPLLEDMRSNKIITIEEQWCSEQDRCIRVQDTSSFQKYRTEISALCDFIEKDGVKRFPAAYASTIIAWEKASCSVCDPKAIYFDDESSALKQGERELHLKPFKLEHLFCRAMYEHPPQAYISWEAVFESMSGEILDIKGDSKSLQRMKDIRKRINRHAKETFLLGSKEFFSWKNNSIKRNF